MHVNVYSSVPVRARYGHPAPFKLHYAEFGNEDDFDVYYAQTMFASCLGETDACFPRYWEPEKGSSIRSR